MSVTVKIHDEYMCSFDALKAFTWFMSADVGVTGRRLYCKLGEIVTPTKLNRGGEDDDLADPLLEYNTVSAEGVLTYFAPDESVIPMNVTIDAFRNTEYTKEVEDDEY